jgi:hypothetical protein
MPMDSEQLISKYRIGKDSRVRFVGDTKTYYVKNVAPDRKSLFVTDGNQVYRKLLSKLEKVDGKEIIKESACSCGCGGCAKAPMLNEQLVARTGLSEGMLYHIDNKKPLTEHLFRAGSQKYFELWKEARMLYSRDLLEVKGDDLEILLETDLGHLVEHNGQIVPLDYPIELTEEELLSEAAKTKKKNPPLSKPMRDSSGGKAYKVYVKDPKTGNIKIVRFGSGGLRAKINDPKARQAFAKRHKCSTRNDKTKASYWSCRLPRYAKLLGLKSNFSGFW